MSRIQDQRRTGYRHEYIIYLQSSNLSSIYLIWYTCYEMLKKMECFTFLVEAYHISQRVVRFVLKFHYFSFYVITCFNMFQPVLILSSKTDSRDGGSGELWHHGLLHILLWIPQVWKRLRNYMVINHTKVCYRLINRLHD